MGKQHHAYCDRGNESYPYDEWSETACGLELEPDYLTNREEWVTCKNCLRVLERYRRINANRPITGTTY